MKISEILSRGKVTVSCEVFPPKRDSDLEQVRNAVYRIAALKPAFLSVTYGAGGGTSRNTMRLAAEVQRRGIPALAHLTCAASTKEEVAALLDGCRKNHIENILALRGDIPRGSNFPSPGQYHYASELVSQIKEAGGFCIGAACYPEGHVECEHREDDIDFLKHKVECGCDFLTTQMFFDNNILYNFLYRILAKGIRVPVVAGIMPVTNSRQIRRICALSGTALPPRFRRIVDKFADRPEAMKQAGIAYATEQIIDLISNGVNAVHIYTMNKPDVAGKILENLSEIIG
ncbi:MAG: methylenetetrahydrofolate reductase [NAD(P)H] [Oscillospiraceae bacterium]|jgi:methylenetetrahydrofolate reductase (NADPH)|nr:methylenetetrahydrofolate reductase [NAD(P)H] [Oscillospiraceae bacterium]MCI2035419.1 methylenetetrahydrofolate reductase [NAD(P)H] [Oscillospiraceae bacterium]